MAVQVVKEIGINLGQTTPKSVQQLADEEFDYIITLGERAPSYGWIFASAQIIHWKFDNADAPDDANKQLRRFQKPRDQILQRLRLFVLVHVRPRITSGPATQSMVATAR